MRSLVANSALLAILVACATQPTPDPRVCEVGRACTELVAAPPSEWPEHMRMVLRAGPSATAPLQKALQENADGAGCEAAVATLGRLGGACARAFATEQVRGRTPLAIAAALALGDCAEPADRDTLLAAATDRLADPTLRAGCVPGLLRLGAYDQVRDLVRGIVLADTPAGRDLHQLLGLPHKPRWAYERYLVIAALRRAAGSDFGLDTDAAWPALEEAAARIDAWLEAQQ